jgi:hypothetical protein
MPKSINEKIIETEKELTQLENYKKRLLQKYKKGIRKERTHRLIERGDIAESLIENSESLTNEEYKSILKKALNTDG